MIYLSNYSFTKKKDLEAFVRSKVNHEDFHPTDPLWFELIKRHPEYEAKVGSGIYYFKRKISPLNAHFYLIIVRTDGTEVDFSWKSCVSGKSTSNIKNLFAAMRASAFDFVDEFKKDALDENPYCEICEKFLESRKESHVDHVIQFSKLLNDFLKTKQGNFIPVEFDDCPKTNQPFFKKDKQSSFFKFEWEDYHADNSKLRLLCPSCNLKRPKEYFDNSIYKIKPMP